MPFREIVPVWKIDQEIKEARSSQTAWVDRLDELHIERQRRFRAGGVWKEGAEASRQIQGLIDHVEMKIRLLMELRAYIASDGV